VKCTPAELKARLLSRIPSPHPSWTTVPLHQNKTVEELHHRKLLREQQEKYKKQEKQSSQADPIEKQQQQSSATAASSSSSVQEKSNVAILKPLTNETNLTKHLTTQQQDGVTNSENQPKTKTSPPAATIAPTTLSTTTNNNNKNKNSKSTSIGSLDQPKTMVIPWVMPSLTALKDKEDVSKQDRDRGKEKKEKDIANKKLTSNMLPFQEVLKMVQVCKSNETLEQLNCSQTTRREVSNWKRFIEHFSFDAKVVEMCKTQLSLNEGYNKLYVVDCGGGGDCLFYVIAKSLQLSGIPQFKTATMPMMREWAADMLTETNFVEFMHDHKNIITNVSQSALTEMKATIQRSGNDYQGETGTLQFLLLHHPEFRKLKLGFLVLNLNFKRDGFIVQYFVLQDTQWVMMLYCTGNHWLLAGVDLLSMTCSATTTTATTTTATTQSPMHHQHVTSTLKLSQMPDFLFAVKDR